MDELAPPLPVVVPTPNNFQPQFPYPFDETRASVTPAEVTAEGEMCQWYNAQYETLMTQIDNFDINLTKSLGRRLGKHSIRVNAIAPGLIKTAMGARAPESSKQRALSSALGR